MKVGEERREEKKREDERREEKKREDETGGERVMMAALVGPD